MNWPSFGRKKKRQNGDQGSCGHCGIPMRAFSSGKNQIYSKLFSPQSISNRTLQPAMRTSYSLAILTRICTRLSLSVLVNHPFVLCTMHLGIKLRLTWLPWFIKTFVALKRFFFESWKYNLGVSFLLRCWIKSNRRQSKGSTARWSIWCRTIWPFPIAQCFTYHHSHEIGYYGWVGIGLILCFVVLYNKKRKTRSIFELIHFTIHTTRSKWITLTISLIQNSRF